MVLSDVGRMGGGGGGCALCEGLNFVVEKGVDFFSEWFMYWFPGWLLIFSIGWYITGSGIGWWYIFGIKGEEYASEWTPLQQLWYIINLSFSKILLSGWFGVEDVLWLIWLLLLWPSWLSILLGLSHIIDKPSNPPAQSLILAVLCKVFSYCLSLSLMIWMYLSILVLEDSKNFW